MLVGLEELTPHMLGVFMIALACIPLIFVWQDRGRKQAERERMARLQREARVAARLRAKAPAEPVASLPVDWLGDTGR